ncbi:HPP family protein [Burkholderia sp. JP2-270]|uniref:HPP family protein n=1 Tax=Burkholderia sp. JP2-270 TaxID=2217913 RepID=UPI0013A6D7F9|nr:HPP family protein [Burkholderia sp. JP2-270]
MTQARSIKSTLPAACLTVLYLCFVSTVGKVVHNEFAFFPELAALGYGMFMRPAGPWARSPLMVVTTTAATALWGVGIASHLPYGIPAAILCIAGSILIVKAMKSPVFPAVPAGFLPLVFNVTSLHYCAFIIFDTGLLALLSMAYRFWWQGSFGRPAAPPANPPAQTLAAGKVARWITFACVLAFTYFLAARTDLRLILFPPLLVIAYETLVRPETCPWARRTAFLPAICVVTAGFGWASIALFDTGPLSVLCALGASIVFIRAIDVFILPALAISVIPQIMPHTDWKYPVAIGTGTVVVVAARAVLGTLRQSQARSAESASS